MNLSYWLSALLRPFYSKSASTSAASSPDPSPVVAAVDPLALRAGPLSSSVDATVLRLRVVRDLKLPECTLGKLFVDDTFECFTLEDAVRDGPKVWGETAIPEGRYECRITPSPRFKRDLPLLLDVPGFSGIRIHPGNTHEDTHGCLLVGQARDASKGVLFNSRLAFENIFARIKAAPRCEVEVVHLWENVT